jgi:hypothetical protein
VSNHESESEEFEIAQTSPSSVYCYQILSYPFLSYPVLSCSIMFCSVLSNSVLSRPILSCPVLAYPILPIFFSFCPILSFSSVICILLSYPIQFCSILYFIPNRSMLLCSSLLSSVSLLCLLVPRYIDTFHHTFSSLAFFFIYEKKLFCDRYSVYFSCF